MFCDITHLIDPFFVNPFFTNPFVVAPHYTDQPLPAIDEKKDDTDVKMGSIQTDDNDAKLTTTPNTETTNLSTAKAIANVSNRTSNAARSKQSQQGIKRRQHQSDYHPDQASKAHEMLQQIQNKNNDNVDVIIDSQGKVLETTTNISEPSKQQTTMHATNNQSHGVHILPNLLQQPPYL